MLSPTGLQFRSNSNITANSSLRQSQLKPRAKTTTQQFVKNTRRETVFKSVYQYEEKEIQTSRTSSVVSIVGPPVIQETKPRQKHSPEKKNTSLVPVKSCTVDPKPPLLSVYNTKTRDDLYQQFQHSLDKKDPPPVPKRGQKISPPIPPREAKVPPPIPHRQLKVLQAELEKTIQSLKVERHECVDHKVEF